MATDVSIKLGVEGESQLKSALSGVNAQMKALKAEMNEAVSGFTKITSAEEKTATQTGILGRQIDAATQKVAIIEKQYSAATTKLEELDKALAEANAEFGENSAEAAKAQSAYNRQATEVNKLSANLSKAKTELNTLNGEMSKLNPGKLEQMSAAAAEMGNKFKDAGEKLTNAGKAMAPVTAAITGAFGGAVKLAADFESAMSQVQATMGISKDAVSELNGETVNTMDSLGSLAKEMGATTAFSAKECAEALNYLALAGYNTQDIYNTLPTVLNLAAAGGLDLAAASDMVTDAMSALGMQTSDADKMVDQMAKTASSTNTDIAMLGEGMLTIGATAKNLKGGTAELATALGILASNGIKGAEGGTHLRNVILSLQSPTDKAADMLAELGVETYDAEGNMRSLNDIMVDLNESMDGLTQAEKDNIISKIFNKTDLAAVGTLLTSCGDSWDELQSSIENSGGAAAEMADTQMQNLKGQLKELSSALEGLAISVGDTLMPAIKSITDKVQEFVDWLNGLDESTKETIVYIGLAVAAIGPALLILGGLSTGIGAVLSVVGSLPMVIGAVTSAFGLLSGALGVVAGAMASFGAVLLANPIGIVIAAIAALVAAVVYLWNTSEEFKNNIIQAWENIKAAYNDVADWFGEKWDAAKQRIQTAWEAVKSFVPETWATIKEKYSDVTEWFGAKFDGAKQRIETAWGAVKSFLPNTWTSIKQTYADVVAYFGGKFDAAKQRIESAWNGIKTFFSGVWTSIKSVFNGDDFATIGGNLVAGLKRGIEKAWTAFKNYFTGKIKSLIESAKELLGIASPSKVFAQIGLFVIQGLANGIRSSDDANKAIAEQAASMMTTCMSVAEQISTALESKIAELEKLIENETDKATKEAYKKQLDEIKQFSTDYDKALTAIENRVSSLATKLEDYGALFEKVRDEESGIETLQLADLQDQIDQIYQFGTAVEQLKARGIDSSLLNEIIGMNTGDAQKYMDELLKMTDEDYKKYMQLWGEKQKAASDVANAFYREELNAVNTNYVEKLPNLLGGLKGQLYTVGSMSIQGMAAGMESQESSLLTVARRIISDMVAEMREAADIHSPSKLMASMLGKPLAQGVAVGFEKTMEVISPQMASAMMTPMRTIKTDDLYNATAGAVNGMAAAQAGGTSQQTIHIPINLDGKTIAEVVFDPLKQVSRQKGVSLA